MKKNTIFDYIKALFIPKRMAMYKDFSFFISFSIFIIGIFIAVGPSNLFARNYVEKAFISQITSEELNSITDESKIEIPVLNIKSSLVNTIDYPKGYENVNEYNFALTSKDNKIVNLKMVYEIDYIESDEENETKLNFDLNKYYNQTPKENEVDVLMLFTGNKMHYLFNHGYKVDSNVKNDFDATSSIYQTDDDGTDILFLPATGNELVGNIADWSNKTTKDQLNDDNVKVVTLEYTSIDNKLPIDEAEALLSPIQWTKTAATDEKVSYDINVEAQKKLLPKLSQLSGTGKIEFDYFTLNNNVLNLLEFEGNGKDLFNGFIELLTIYGINNVRSVNMQQALIFTMTISLVFCVVTWMMMRKNGYLKFFKEYYAILAISYLTTSILIGVLGIFIPYALFVRFTIVMQFLYFMICIYIINNPKNKSTLDNEINFNKPTNVEHLVSTKSKENFEID